MEHSELSTVQRNADMIAEIVITSAGLRKSYDTVKSWEYTDLMVL